ncbi:MAG: GPI anchored serine-threonine rich family protein [Candidatus Cloacimonas sp.]|nr:GPI anchored serine-threonine rich family protein [Candidatus Cloacimonas sp.]
MKTTMLTCILFIFVTGLLALSGYDTSAPVINDTVDPTLSILTPNGGEAWYIGDTNDITWTASDTNLSPNSIYLWCSLNGGTDYLPLAEGIANDGTESWLIPSPQSYNAKVQIKVSDSFGNFTQKASASPFTITYVPLLAPTGITVDISNGVDAVISWQEVTETIYHTPLTPDGYIVLYNETPYEDDQFYNFLASVTGLSHTHYNVAQSWDQMFYKVIAYKDYDGRMAEVLARAKANPELKFSLADIKQALVSASIGGEK